VVVSDHRDLDFGLKYGLLIEEHRLLARAVIVIDRDDVVRYVEVVKEIGEHPDYDKVFEKVKELI
ncbi:MAG: redoxin family protein, partial [Bacteroidales bacterium]